MKPELKRYHISIEIKFEECYGRTPGTNPHANNDGYYGPFWSMKEANDWLKKNLRKIVILHPLHDYTKQK